MFDDYSPVSFSFIDFLYCLSTLYITDFLSTYFVFNFILFLKWILNIDFKIKSWF